MKGHDTCVHAHLEEGVMYCVRTHLLYLRTDKIPTETRRKIRGTEFEVFARKAACYYMVLRDRGLQGFLMLRTSVDLPAPKDGDVHSIVDLVRLPDMARREPK